MTQKGINHTCNQKRIKCLLNAHQVI